jgi:hypothetical protein
MVFTVPMLAGSEMLVQAALERRGGTRVFAAVD